MEPNKTPLEEVEVKEVKEKPKKEKKNKKPKKEKRNNRNILNTKKAKLKDSIDVEIEKANKEMEELMKNIQEEMGTENIKVVRIDLPKPSFKNFLIETGICLLLNLLLILGMNGFLEFFIFDNIWQLVLYSLYYTVVDRLIVFVFAKLFTPLIIRSMGLASLIPPILSMVICLTFPIFVGIENIAITILVMVLLSILRTFLMSYIRNKLIINKIRRKK